MNAATKRTKKRTAAPPRVHVMGWQVLSTLQLIVEGHSRRLLVQLANVPGSVEWLLTAFESAAAPSPQDDAEIEKELSDLFEDHAHKVVGREPGMVAAILAAERYAAKWQRAHADAEACGCGEIAELPSAASHAIVSVAAADDE